MKCPTIIDNNINSIEIPDVGEVHYIKSGDNFHITSIYVNEPRQGQLTKIFPCLKEYIKSKGINTISMVSPHQLWSKFGFKQLSDNSWKLEL